MAWEPITIYLDDGDPHFLVSNLPENGIPIPVISGALIGTTESMLTICGLFNAHLTEFHNFPSFDSNCFGDVTSFVPYTIQEVGENPKLESGPIWRYLIKAVGCTDIARTLWLRFALTSTLLRKQNYRISLNTARLSLCQLKQTGHTRIKSFRRWVP